MIEDKEDFMINRDNVLIKCNKTDKDVAIPDGVTKIAWRAFAPCCKSLENVFFPEGVTEIGQGAFWGCRSLKKVFLNDNHIKTYPYAFKNCESLEYIYGKCITEIGNNTFENCTALKEIEISGLITKIGEDAFKGCMSLERIAIPDFVLEDLNITEEQFAKHVGVDVKVLDIVKVPTEKDLEEMERAAEISQYGTDDIGKALGTITHYSEYIAGGDIAKRGCEINYYKSRESDNKYYEVSTTFDDYGECDYSPCAEEVTYDEIVESFAGARQHEFSYKDIYSGCLDVLTTDGVDYTITDDQLYDAVIEYEKEKSKGQEYGE